MNKTTHVLSSIFSGILLGFSVAAIFNVDPTGLLVVILGAILGIVFIPICYAGIGRMDSTEST